MSEIEKCTEEIEAWKTLLANYEILKNRYEEITDDSQELSESLQEQGQRFQEHTDEILEKIDTLIDSTEATADRLETLPGKLQEAVEEAKEAMQESMDSLSGIASEVESMIREGSDTLKEGLLDFLKNARESIEAHSQEEFFEKIEEQVNEELSNLEEATDGLIEHAVKEIDSTKEQVLGDTTKFEETFKAGFSEWISTIEQLRSTYNGVFNTITNVSETVDRLNSSIQTAMESSGGGLTAATQSIDEIKSVMDSIV